MSSVRPDSTDRTMLRRCLEEGTERALSALLAGHPWADDVLRAGLETLGGDSRGSVNLLAPVSEEVLERLSQMESRPGELEPSQHYCAADDIPLTLFEIYHSRALSEARYLAKRLSAAMPDLLAHASPFRLDSPRLGFDEGGVALNFTPPDMRTHVSLRGPLPLPSLQHESAGSSGEP